MSGSDSDDSEEEGSRKESTLSALLKKQATLAESARTSKDGSEDDGWTPSRKGRTGSPLLWLSSAALPPNTYLGVYKALFTNEELENESKIPDAIRSRQLVPVVAPKASKDEAPPVYKGPHIFLCMLGGGHFAAMVVSLAPLQTKAASGGSHTASREATVLAHKTFHRYTTRRKQGGSQSASDASKGAAHSAGSSLRRYNEQALTEEVRALLHDWKALLDSSALLFVRANGVLNRRTLFGPYEGQVLNSRDKRLRGFPFSTRRATQNELMRAFVELTRLKVREIAPTPVEVPTSAPPTSSSAPPPAPQPAGPSEEEEALAIHTTQIQALIRRGKLPALISYLRTSSLLPLSAPPSVASSASSTTTPTSFRFHPPEHHTPTPLHLAAHLGGSAGGILVHGLLTRAGADPTVRNGDGRTPFELARDAAVRDAFRVARWEMGEDAWNWGDDKTVGGVTVPGGRVPPAMTKAEADARRAETERAAEEERRAEAERRRREEERLRREDAATAASRASAAASSKGTGLRRTAQERREDERRAMTPEQRMRLDRELRARAAEERIRRAKEGGG